MVSHSLPFLSAEVYGNFTGFCSDYSTYSISPLHVSSCIPCFWLFHVSSVCIGDLELCKCRCRIPVTDCRVLWSLLPLLGNASHWTADANPKREFIYSLPGRESWKSMEEPPCRKPTLLNMRVLITHHLFAAVEDELSPALWNQEIRLSQVS